MESPPMFYSKHWKKRFKAIDSKIDFGHYNQSRVRESVTRGEGVSTPQRPFRVPYDRLFKRIIVRNY